MDIGIKVLGNFYPSDGDGVNNCDRDYAERGGRTVLASYDQGRGLQPELPPIENGPGRLVSNVNSVDDDCLMWQTTTGLPFADTHYASSVCVDDNERLFKSLELGNGAASDFDDQVENRHHHSMDDLVNLSSHQRNRSAPGVPKGNVHVAESRRGVEKEKEDEDDIETVKNLFLSAWINTKNGWLIPTNTSFKRDSPIWLLGQVYHCSRDEKSKDIHISQLRSDNANTQFEKFKIDFKSRLWFTYRKDIPTLPESHLKSDAGWGCMMRCGQMLLAQALSVHLLQREWNWNPCGDETIHRQIIRYFGDVPHRSSPFSIHKLVEIGISHLGKKPGDWYGPASIAHALRHALQNAQQYDSQLSELSFYIARDGVVYGVRKMKFTVLKGKVTQCFVQRQEKTKEKDFVVVALEDENVHGLTVAYVFELHRVVVYIQDVFDEYQTERPQPPDSPAVNGAALSSPAQIADHERAIILIVPMRLGGETINQIHVPCLKTMLNTKQCIGIIGGKPRHSMYFMGWQDDKLIYLDPHCCQDFVDTTPTQFPLSTFHCVSPRKMAFSKMDPSCAVGFFCRTRSELRELLREIPKIVATPLSRNFPMFQVVDGRYSDVEVLPGRVERRTRQPVSRYSDGNEDFTLL